MRNLLKWSVVAGGSMLSLLTAGCGSMTNLADQANQATNAQSADQSGSGESSSSSGGSLALSSTNEADASVKKIRIKVQTSLQCDDGEGMGGHRHGHKEGHDRRPPPPPPRGKGERGEGKGGMPPHDDRDDDQDFKLADDTQASTDAAAEQPADEQADDKADDKEDRPSQCVVAEADGDFDAASALQLDNIPVGTYYVVVVLSDENGRAVQQGNAQVEIKAGEVSAAEITLEKVPEGGVSVTIKQAAEETTASSDAASTGTN